jgi:hypothetical protein
MDLWSIFELLSNHPVIRVATLLISLASFALAFVAFRKTNQAVENYWRNTKAEQGRYLEAQWRDLYRLTFSSPEFAAQAAQVFGHSGEPQARREAALLMYVNLCSVAYGSFREGVIDRSTLDGHLSSFFGHFKGDPAELGQLLKLKGYEADFRAECLKHLKPAGGGAIG